MDIFTTLADQVLNFASDHVYLALFLLLFIEESGIPLPLPGDTLILLAGAGVADGYVNRWIALVLVVAAVCCGSSILYWVSRLGGLPVVRRVARAVRISDERLDRFRDQLHRHPGKAIVIGRLIPGFRIITSAVAGTFAVPYPIFVLSSAVAALAWGAAYLLIGAFFHDAYRSLAHQLTPGPLALVVLAFVIAALVVLFRRRRGLHQDSH